MKNFILLILLFIVLILLGLGYRYLNEPRVTLFAKNFANLTHWQSDNHLQAFNTFKNSCAEILKRPSDTQFSNLSYGGKTKTWQDVCRVAINLKNINNKQAKDFFENYFQPYQIKNNFTSKGLFTGYYLPTINIRYVRNKEFSIPIYALPKDLIKIDLGKFKKELSGITVTAQLNKNILQPYPDRETITAAPLKSADVIAWTNSPVDLFFAQIQGSAIGILPDKSRVLLSYAGGNGRPYQPIGKILLEKKELSRDNVSMQAIRDWLNKHPDKINLIFNQNASYSFFVLNKTENVIGSEKIPLTPRRSLAVDRKFIPLGAPLWLSTHIPMNKSQSAFHHLMVAQDTGGAINGVIRGDVYWGEGKEASDIAGHMQQSGRLWILLPKRLTS